MNTPCDWRGLSNVQCNAVGAHRAVWWRLVGAAPMCPPESPCRGASIVHPRAQCVYSFVWKRRYADVRAGTQAPPLRFRLGRLRVGRLISFGQITRGRLMPFGQIAYKWLFCLCGMRGKICWRLVGAVPMCPPASPCKSTPIVQTPTHNTCIFGMETPLRGRSGGHAGTAPTVSFGQIMC